MKNASAIEFRTKMRIAIAGNNEELARDYAISLVRATRKQVRNHSSRERYQAMKDLGLVKTPYGWE